MSPSPPLPPPPPAGAAPYVTPADPQLQCILAAVAETTASLVIITDAADRIEWVNPSFVRVTGWTLPEVAGRTPRELLNGPDTEQDAEWIQAHKERRAGGAVDAVEMKLYRRDGEPYWALTEVRPMRDQRGQVTHHLHLQTDVSARVLAERRADDSQRWLKLASSLFGLGLCQTSLPDGVMIWDGGLKQIFGLARDAITPSLDQLLDRFVHPDDRERVARSAREVPAAGAHTEIEYRIRRLDGRPGTIVVRQACVDYGPGGRPQRLLAAVLDVTDARATTVQLRDALRRLRLAAEASGIGAWERDMVTDEGHWDPTMFTLLGRLPADRAPSREETLEMVHPDDRATVQTAWQRMMDEPRPVEYEYRIVKPDGGIAYIVTRGMTVERDASGRALRALGTVIDVTAQRLAERERDELAQRMQLVADAVGLGTWEWEPIVRRSRWNDMMYVLFGTTREAFRDRLWFEALHPDDLARARQAFEAAASAGHAIDIEFRVLHPGGQVRWIAARGRSHRGADGRVLRVMGVNWDITDRVRMEQTALAAERTARDLLERMLLATSATGIGVWERDVATGTLTWDRQMYLLFGREPACMPPLSLWQEAVHPADRSLVDRRVEDAIDTGQRFDAEFRVLLPDGSVRWLAGRGILRDGANGSTMLGINWDITERRLAENALRAKETAERASAAKTEFLSRMSHELRTPLNAILGFTQLLELDGREPLSRQQHERVGHIREAGWHLLTLINEVLDLSRIEAGAARIEVTAVPVRPVLDECLTLINGEAQRRLLKVVVRTQAGAPPTVQADRVRLKQVLLNLLSNAVKYNRDGGRIDITLAPTEDGRGLIAVRDSGIGIHAAQMDTLFQPFNRLGLESAPIEGTGIGLTIALKLAEQMGGSLEASSEPGVGSEFRLTLRAQPNGAGPGEPAAPPPRLAAPLPAERHDIAGSVLCVEDNDANVQLVQQLLRLRPNVTLFVARDAAAARMLAPVCQPDLILLDLRLPDGHGLPLLAELRHHGSLATVPCVALSANVLAPDLAAARAAGVDEYLTKPVDAAALLDCIDRLLPAVP